MTFNLWLTSVFYVSQSFNIAYRLDATFAPSEHRKHHVLETRFSEPIACNLLPLLVPLYSQKDKVAVGNTTLLGSDHLVYSVRSMKKRLEMYHAQSS